MKFDVEYQTFINHHLQARKGERLRRLKEGHNYAEKLFLKEVWWPSFYNFEYLHPEYEVQDYNDGKRYLDFAYIRPTIRICFEIDGYGPHLQNISRWQFIDSLERQNHLVVDRWFVLRFSVDQIKSNPKRCQQIIQQFIGRFIVDELKELNLSVYEREIIRLAIQKGGPISPKEIRNHLNLSDKPVKKILNQLMNKKILFPTCAGKTRIHYYQISDTLKH